MEKIGVALAGFGSIGRIHLLAYQDIPHYYPGVLPPIDLVGVVRSSPGSAHTTAKENNFRKSYDTYEELLQEPEVKVIDLVTPNYLHKDQIIQAIKAGKHILCEKPLALNGTEAREISAAVAKSQTQVGMIFNYRFIPAIQKAKSLIDEGRIGQVYSFRGEYFHTGYQDPKRTFNWRMDFDRSGGGALVDLGVHILDLLRFLLGDFSTVRADLQTFIKERPTGDPSGAMAKVTVDDAAWLQCTLVDGAKGSVEVSRFATGTLDDLNITIHGSRGSMMYRLMDPGYLYFYEEAHKSNGWSRLEPMQHFPGAKIPNPRSVIGWQRFHTENQYQFLKAIYQGIPFAPNNQDGTQVQLILDAAYKSATSGREEGV